MKNVETKVLTRKLVNKNGKEKEIAAEVELLWKKYNVSNLGKLL